MRSCGRNWCWARRWNAISPNGSALACAVISAPDACTGFPRAAIRRRWDSKGANVLFDSFVHPLMMGLEEHLIGMFRERFRILVPMRRPRAISAVTQPRALPVGIVGGCQPAGCRRDGLGGQRRKRNWGKFRSLCVGRLRRNTEKFALDRGRRRRSRWTRFMTRRRIMHGDLASAEVLPFAAAFAGGFGHHGQPFVRGSRRPRRNRSCGAKSPGFGTGGSRR